MTTVGNVSASVIPTECSNQGQPLRWQRRCSEVAIEVSGLSDLPRDDIQLSAAEVMRIVNDSFAVWEAASVGAGIEVKLLDQASNCDLAEFNSSGGNMNTIVFANDWPERGYSIDGIYSL
ncbi:MAG: hypothetical protein IPJ88_07450 [Myxococcales bacterium]|nr:MAG: hypothetical protein IPJ88_07450 [Myxococcales bacterium]